ncbi:MAG: DoxX family protein [Marmoricola sp.]|jgi:putative oxidoreductase|nr:DoxX family protein [Marmoricola sp.]
MTVTRLIARPLLASTFVVGGVSALKNAPALAAKAKPVTDRLRPALAKAAPQVSIPEDTVTLVRINAAAQIVAGVALARGRAPRLSSTVLAASLLPTTVAGHQFWKESDPTVKANQQIHFFKNLSMVGGLLLASVDTEGRPGVAWRARHGAGAVRREAKHLRREAKLQAKVAAKSIG